MENTVQHLLSQVSLINKKYDDIAKITGEKFNVFEVLDLSTNETRTHSAFLAELLKPKGKHGLGSLMLKQFLKIINFNQFDAETATVSIERGIGNNTYEEGGRIDIIIEDANGYAIIIENKINAIDQQMQLLRYSNYAQKNFKDDGWKLLYLNLTGKPPSDISTGPELRLDDHYQIISYKETIVTWLDECKKEATNHPLLRETISQYINLIKKLTGQTINQKMKEEIVEIIVSNGNNVVSAFGVYNSIVMIKQKLLSKFAEKLMIRVLEINPEVDVEISDKFGNKYNGIYFSLPHLEREYIQLSAASDLGDFYLEVVNENNNGKVEDKMKANIDYYKNRLSKGDRNFGKVENMEKGWHGDWVCRYTKLDSFFQLASNWGAIADNKYDIINEVSQDINELIIALKEK